MRGGMARGRDESDNVGGTGSNTMIRNASAPSGIGIPGGPMGVKRKRKSKGSSIESVPKRDSGTALSGAPVPTASMNTNGRAAPRTDPAVPAIPAIPTIPAVLPNGPSASPSTPTLEDRSRSPSQTHGQPRTGQPSVQHTRSSPSVPTHPPVPGQAALDRDTVLMRASVSYSEAFPIKEDRVGPQHFKKLKLLGRGGIGRVFLVVLKGTDKLYAMKVLTKEEMIQRNKVKRVMTEREILATANHPFIVTMYASFQTVDRLCFVMEYCEGGEFFRVLQRQPKKRLTEVAVRFYAAEVTLALEYLHHLGFIYRDLKPENILMRADGHIALTDFDLSKQAHAIGPRVLEKEQSLVQKFRKSLSLKRQASNLNNLEIVDVEPVLPYQTNSFVGTEEYISPEVVKGVGQSATVDWWTLGILIYEMLTGTTPFKGSYTDETFANIVNHTLKWPDDVIISSECKQLVKRLLKRDSQRRLGSENGASDIKREKWFKDFNFELIRNETPPIIPKIRDPKDMAQYNKFPQEEENHEPFDDANPNNVFPHFYIRRDSEVQRQY